MAKYLKEKEEAFLAVRSARTEAERMRMDRDRFKKDNDALMAERQGTGSNPGLTYA